MNDSNEFKDPFDECQRLSSEDEKEEDLVQDSFKFE